jgi:hypothetical protein
VRFCKRDESKGAKGCLAAAIVVAIVEKCTVTIELLGQASILSKAQMISVVEVNRASQDFASGQCCSSGTMLLLLFFFLLLSPQYWNATTGPKKSDSKWGEPDISVNTSFQVADAAVQ